MAPTKDKHKDLGFDISAAKCSVTESRPVATHAESKIKSPSLPRANAATITDAGPSTSYSEKFKEYTVLQQHILFWDRDLDGIITPYDTYIGFRDLGFNILLSALAVIIVNASFSYPTRLAHSRLPDPFFRIYVDGIHKAKHGSDTGVIDTEGRFIPQRFQDIFSKYDKDSDGAITFREMYDLISGQRVAADPFGWAAAIFEWWATWLLIQKGGKVYKEDLLLVYDGSMFWRIRDARKA